MVVAASMLTSVWADFVVFGEQRRAPNVLSPAHLFVHEA
jgi:hypothetical protein